MKVNDLIMKHFLAKWIYIPPDGRRFYKSVNSCLKYRILFAWEWFYLFCVSFYPHSTMILNKCQVSSQESVSPSCKCYTGWFNAQRDPIHSNAKGRNWNYLPLTIIDPCKSLSSWIWRCKLFYNPKLLLRNCH